MRYYYLKDNMNSEYYRNLFISWGAVIGTNLFQEITISKFDEESQYLHLRSIIQSGDTLIVPNPHTLGHNAREIVKEQKYWMERKVHLMYADLPGTCSENENDEWIVLQIFQYLADRESGSVRRKKSAVQRGRQPIVLPDNWPELYEQWRTHEKTAADIIEQYGFKRSTFYKVVKDYEDRMRES